MNPTRYGNETWDDNSVDTCNLPWRYQKLQLIARLLCCVSTLYVYMSKCCFTNVKSKHKERPRFNRLSVRIFPRLLKISKILINFIPEVQYPPLWWCWQSHSHHVSNNPPLWVSVATDYPKTSLMLHSYI